MASAMYPEDTKATPPPYGFQSETNSGVSYQQPVSSPMYPPQFGSSQSPPQMPVYTQPIVFNPVMGAPFLGHNPTPMQCPNCRQQVITAVQYESGSGTWLIALIICLFGGVFGCCLIPFCVPACQDAVHSCPSCRNLIGRRNLF